MCQTCYEGKLHRGCSPICYCKDCNYENGVICTDWLYPYPKPLPSMDDNQINSICNIFNTKANLFS